MRYYMRNIFLWLTVSLIFTSIVSGKIKSVGTPFILNYPKDIYSAGTQNWSITQDKKGIMYFGNNNGVLVFDGIYWRIYTLPNYSLVRSVAVDAGEKIWAGGFNEVGFFKSTNSGQLIYHSVVEQIPQDHKDFGEIWRIFKSGDQMIVQSFSKIFIFQKDSLQKTISGYDMHFSFMVNDTLIVKVNGEGLFKLDSDSLSFIPGTKFFKDKVVSGINPLNRKEKLIFTSENGVFVLGNSRIRLFNKGISDYLSKNQIFYATSIEDNYIAGTVRNGILIFDSNGKILQKITRDDGLQNSTILSIFVDKTDNIWLGLDNGIDYIRSNSPISYLAYKDDIGAGYVSVTYKDKIFLGTNQGLYFMDWDNTPQLKRQIGFLQGTQGQVWNLKVAKDLLLIGHDKGSFSFDGKKLVKISKEQGGWIFHEIPGKSNLMIQGLYEGLAVYEYDKANGWRFRNKIDGFNESSRELYFDKEGFIWIGRGYKGIYKLGIDSSLRKVITINEYNENNGLNTITGIHLHLFEEKVVVSNDLGYFTYDNGSDQFIPDKRLNSYFNYKNVNKFITDPNMNIWFFHSGMMGILRPTYDGSYIMEYLPFAEIANKFIPTFESINFIDLNNVIIASEDGFIHFDPNFRKSYDIEFPSLIRMVTVADSIINYGNKKQEYDAEEVQLPYSMNSVSIAFSAPRYINQNDLRFSYFLDGFDQDWSEWGNSTEKEYTNLTEGEYTFYVKAMDQFGNVSQQDIYQFQILPPWYRSTTAYILYVLTIIVSIFLVGLYIVRKIEKEKTLLKRKQERELYERERAFHEEAMRSEQEIIKLKNEKLQIENQKNKAELENKSKELASIAMQMTYKNEILSGIKQKLSKVSQTMVHLPSKKQVEELIKSLEKDIVKDDDWERFELSFDQVHEDFIKKLRIRYPELTPKDLRLCAYLRMNLSSKEIAPLLNISIRGVEISRYRLRKKIDLPRDLNLVDFMMKL